MTFFPYHVDNVLNNHSYTNYNLIVNHIRFDMEGSICPPFSMSNIVLLVPA